MNNFKKLALGLVVGALAIGGSAFKNAEKALISEDYLIQFVSGQYKPLATTPDPEGCVTSGSLYCLYRLTSAGKTNIPALTPTHAYYTPAEIADWVSTTPSRPTPFLTLVTSSGQGLYNE